MSALRERIRQEIEPWLADRHDEFGWGDYQVMAEDIDKKLDAILTLVEQDRAALVSRVEDAESAKKVAWDRMEVHNKDADYAVDRAEARCAELVEALEKAWERMDRARDILRDPACGGNPKSEWGLLDTKSARAALAGVKEMKNVWGG